MVEFVEEAQPAPATTEPIEARRTPWHLWAVGGLSLLWNCFGATDYMMSQLRNEAWLSAGADAMGSTTNEMIAYIESFPAWMHGFWAIGVWGAFIGSILLLMRSRYAVWLFAASLFGLAVTTIYRVVTPQPEWMQNDLAMNVAIWSVATFLLIYAVSMRNQGVIR